MNFKTFALILSIIAATAFSAQAQLLPSAHHNSIQKAESFDIADKSFADMAFSTSREGTPFDWSSNMSGASEIDMVMAGRVTDFARRFLGRPYVWGATGPKAFDCSGFVGYVFRNFGLHLPRTSGEQYLRGESVRRVADFQPGDLMFFSSRRSGRNGIGHVGMVLSVDKENGTCRFIHASTGKGVVIQSFPDDGYYSTHFKGARRILSPEVVSQLAAK